MIKERKCKVCGETKEFSQFQGKKWTCLVCEDKAEKIKKENEKRRKNKVNNRFRIEYNRLTHFIKYLAILINEGQTNDELRCGFYNERNPPYDLSNTAEYALDKMIRRGKVREHINGRETIGTYIIHAMLIGDIQSWQDLHNFYLKYCVYIFTDSAFNEEVKKLQNNSTGAILADEYIAVYEKYYGLELSLVEKKYFSNHFLNTKYGQVSKDDIFNHIRRDLREC